MVTSKLDEKDQLTKVKFTLTYVESHSAATFVCPEPMCMSDVLAEIILAESDY